MAVHTGFNEWGPVRRFHHWLEYKSFLRSEGLTTGITSPAEKQLNDRFSDGPSNHRYRLRAGRLVPSFQLYERWRTLAPVPPERPETCLDIGCCYGYYVLQTAQRPGCRLAVGIDVHEPFLAAAETAARQLQVPNTVFHKAFLDDIACHPARYGGPFQMVYLLGTYHYLFWGSGRSSHALRSHERILACLSALTTGCILFSARLELNRLPRGVRKRACSSPEANVYNTASFLQAAASFFDVEQAGILGSYPLFVMRKKTCVSVEPAGAAGSLAPRGERSPTTVVAGGAQKGFRARLKEASGRLLRRGEPSLP